ncbi:MAG: hypothetical protein ABI658_08765 [Acidimicrobiales bacterium]
MTAAARNRLTTPVAIGIVVSVVVIVAGLGFIFAMLNEKSLDRFPSPVAAGPIDGAPTGTGVVTGSGTSTATTVGGTTTRGVVTTNRSASTTARGPGTTARAGTGTGAVRTVIVKLGENAVKIVQPTGYASKSSNQGITLTNGTASLYFHLVQRTVGSTAAAAVQADADSTLRSASYSQLQRDATSELKPFGTVTSFAIQSYRGVWTPTGATARSEQGLFIAGAKSSGLTLHVQLYGALGWSDADQTWLAIYKQAFEEFASN